MTETDSSVSSMPRGAKKTVTPAPAERAAVRELVEAARARSRGPARNLLGDSTSWGSGRRARYD